jgi:hypothetical protein
MASSADATRYLCGSEGQYNKQRHVAALFYWKSAKRIPGDLEGLKAKKNTFSFSQCVVENRWFAVVRCRTRTLVGMMLLASI